MRISKEAKSAAVALGATATLITAFKIYHNYVSRETRTENTIVGEGYVIKPSGVRTDVLEADIQTENFSFESSTDPAKQRALRRIAVNCGNINREYPPLVNEQHRLVILLSVDNASNLNCFPNLKNPIPNA